MLLGLFRFVRSSIYAVNFRLTVCRKFSVFYAAMNAIIPMAPDVLYTARHTNNCMDKVHDSLVAFSKSCVDRSLLVCLEKNHGKGSNESLNIKPVRNNWLIVASVSFVMQYT